MLLALGIVIAFVGVALGVYVLVYACGVPVIQSLRGISLKDRYRRETNIRNLSWMAGILVVLGLAIVVITDRIG